MQGAGKSENEIRNRSNSNLKIIDEQNFHHVPSRVAQRLDRVRIRRNDTIRIFGCALTVILCSMGRRLRYPLVTCRIRARPMSSLSILSSVILTGDHANEETPVLVEMETLAALVYGNSLIEFRRGEFCPWPDDLATIFNSAKTLR